MTMTGRLIVLSRSTLVTLSLVTCYSIGDFMSKITALNVNGKSLSVDVDSATSLLNVLRNDLGLTGTKYGCGEAQCGACTVLVDGQATRSCVTPVGRAAGKQ